jgi:hypothetical protein
VMELTATVGLESSNMIPLGILKLSIGARPCLRLYLGPRHGISRFWAKILQKYCMDVRVLTLNSDKLRDKLNRRIERKTGPNFQLGNSRDP